MKYYGIKTPNTEQHPSYIWWISDSEHRSWRDFFRYSDKDGDRTTYRSPIAEAIQAYEAIGYKCVELNVTEKIQHVHD